MYSKIKYLKPYKIVGHLDLTDYTPIRLLWLPLIMWKKHYFEGVEFSNPLHYISDTELT